MIVFLLYATKQNKILIYLRTGRLHLLVENIILIVTTTGIVEIHDGGGQDGSEAESVSE